MKTLTRDLRSRALHEIALPIPFDAGAMPGARVLGDDGREYVSIRWPEPNDSYQWISAAQIAEDVAADVVRVEEAPLVLTVGPTGSGSDFEGDDALNRAFMELAKFIPPRNVFTEFQRSQIVINEGYRIMRPLVVGGVDYSYVELTSEGRRVYVDEAALIPANSIEAEKPYFTTLEFTTNVNFIDLDLEFDYTWGTGQTQIDGREVYGIDLVENIHAGLKGVRIANFTENMRVAQNAYVRVRDTELWNARRYNVSARQGGYLRISSNVLARGAGANSIIVSQSARCLIAPTAGGVDLRKAEGVDSTTDIFVGNSPWNIVAINDASHPVLGGVNLPVNRALRRGIIADSRAPERPTVGTVSQKEGQPNGADFQRGSGPNGHFVRFADGTQICWRVVAHNFNDNGSQNWPFPAEFADINEVAGSWGLQQASITQIDLLYTKRFTSFIRADVPSWRTRAPEGAETAETVDVTLVAFGRWF